MKQTNKRTLAGLLVLSLSLAPYLNIAGQAFAASPQQTASDIAWSSAGSYLAIRLANATGQWADAAAIIPAARKANPDNPDITLAGMVAYIHSGHFDDAVKLAKELQKRVPAAGNLPMLNLLLTTDAVKRGDYKSASQFVAKIPDKGDSQYIVPLLRAWVSFGAGDKEAAKNTLIEAGKLQGFGTVAIFHQALMMEAGKGDPKVIADLFKTALSAEGQLQSRWLELYAGFLSRHDRKEVDELLKKIATEASGNEEGEFSSQLAAQIKSKGKLSLQIADAKTGLAQAFFELAWLFGRQNLVKDSSLFAQMALALNSHLDAASYLRGQINQKARNWQIAVDAYRQITPTSPYWAEAVLSLAQTMNASNQSEEAISLLKKLSEQYPKLSDAPALLGDIYRGDKRWNEAIDAYNLAIEDKKDHIGANDWGLYYYRGTAFERNKQWPEAEKDFLKALELRPDEPYVLNYLAYSWTERKENLGRAVQMLERAAELRPEDGFIIDSLGWVYFQMGNIEKAVPLLERAVELSPADPTLNEHLGDAYWHIGRHNEARFQWNKALVNDPEPEQANAIQDKIKNGIPLVKSGG